MAVNSSLRNAQDIRSRVAQPRIRPLVRNAKAAIDRAFRPTPPGVDQTTNVLRQRPTSIRFKLGLVILLGLLALIGRVFEATPASLVHASSSSVVLAQLVLYDDAFRNGFATSSWSSPQPNPSYTGVVYSGAYSLQKNLVIDGGSGEFMSITRSSGFSLEDYTHVDFYATSISGGGAKIRARFARKSYEGSTEEVPIDVPFGQWTHFQVPFDDFGPTLLGKQFEGIAFSGGGPGADFNDSNNSVAFDEIRLVRLPDTALPQLISAQAVSANVIRAAFNEPIDSAGASSTGNYVVSSSDDTNFLSPRNPVDVLLLPNGREVELTVGNAFSDGATYSLRVSNVRDLAGNAIAANTETSFVFDLVLVDLTVDAGVVVNPFNPMMRGGQLACWMHGQANKPGPNDAANLWEVVKPINPAIVRYCGGLWANNLGWDRYGQAPNNGSWQFTDPDTQVAYPFEYTHSYKPAWIDNLAAFLTRVDAQVMFQANLCDNNPEMWADLVHYTNVENSYGFIYWELSNELELSHGDSMRQKCFGSPDKNVAAREYARRFVTYLRAMKAVDANIKIMGPVPANFYSAPAWFPPLVDELNNAGLELDVLSWHWYQLFEWNEDPNSQAYDFGSIEALLNYNTALTDQNAPYVKGDVIDDPDHWLYRGRRAFAGHTPMKAATYVEQSFPDVELAITELNTHGATYDHPTNGNHIGALWMADVLGRAAYAGQDINIWYQLYDGDFSKYGLIYPDDDVNPTRMLIRPTYYPMLMYNRWSGDTLVKTSTSDSKQDVVVWASTSKDDPDKLYLMLTNLKGTAATANINLLGFAVQSGEYYEMSSSDPLSMTQASTWDSGQTTINGYTVDTTAGQVEASINAIAPRQVTVTSGSLIRHDLPAYSVTSMVLSLTDGPPTPDTTPPVLSSLSRSGILAAGTIQVSMAVNTNENAMCRYAATPGVAYSSMANTFSSTGETVHFSSVFGLQDGKSYAFYVRCRDTSGNAGISDATIQFSVDVGDAGPLPHAWPETADLSIGESYVYALRDGTQRTLKLVYYNIVIPRHRIQATFEVSGNGGTERHTVEVAMGSAPASVNGLRVYAYAWKEANDFGFEQAWPSGDFPMIPGKDVGFALSDAAYSMFPDIGSYTYPADVAFHEGDDVQTFLEPKDDFATAEAHSGYDIKMPNTSTLLALRDGYVWSGSWGAVDENGNPEQGGIWLTSTNDEYGAPEIWMWTHVKNGQLLPGLSNGDFVTKGTPLGKRCTSCSPHLHMGSKDSFDFGSYPFMAEIWNNEHQGDYPAPRYWLALGSYDGDMNANHISSDESGDISSAPAPRKGATDKGGFEQWRFADNSVNSVAMRRPTNPVGYAAT